MKERNIGNILNQPKISISFEFFPPKNEKAAERLYDSLERLAQRRPTFVSVTYGAGGSSRKLTHELVLKIKRMTGITVVPHLTCVGSSRQEIYETVGQYHDAGIKNILALRGDAPKDQADFRHDAGDFVYAVDLIRFIRKEFPDICLGAACYPEGHVETPNRLVEMVYLKKKVDAGADYLTSQMFFDNHEFYDFKARCRLSGIYVPILAGIMPITSRKSLDRIADLTPLTRFPAGLLQAIYRVEDKRIRKIGIHWAAQQVFDLIGHNVDGIHFYTLNRSQPTLEIYESIGLFDTGFLSCETSCFK